MEECFDIFVMQSIYNMTTKKLHKQRHTGESPVLHELKIGCSDRLLFTLLMKGK